MLQSLVESVSYMPHGYCLFWQPWLVTLYAGSDLLIFAAYFAIPVALAQVLRRRPDVKHRGIVWLFAAFILLCGLTHLVSILTLWVGVYPLHGLVKLATGLVSAATAVVLFRMIPTLVALPSPSQLESVNDRLRAEIAAHERTLAELREAKRTLEDRVARRTAELSEANRKLQVLTGEAVHRGKNLLAVVNAIARQTARGAADLAGFLDRFMGRIDALAVATASVRDSGEGTGALDLGQVIRRQLDPVTQAFGGRIRVDGPDTAVSHEAAQQFALLVHELATNCVKHGSLARPEGAVAVGWSVSDDTLSFRWHETAGGPASLAGEAAGFGMRLLTQLLPAMLQGVATLDPGDDGLDYRLDVPLARLRREGDDLRDIAGEPLAGDDPGTGAAGLAGPA